MTSLNAPDTLLSMKAHRARLRQVELPPCNALRVCASLTALAQYLATTAVVKERVDLTIVIQSGFAISGFLLVGFLLRGRLRGPSVRDGSGNPRTPSPSRSVLQGLPLLPIFGSIAALVYLPPILAMETIPIVRLNELPVAALQWMTQGFSDFRQSGFDGQTLRAWPIVLVVAPRRLLGLIFLGVLGAGLMIQVSGLVSGEIRPASVLVSASALDLFSAGALFAAMLESGGRSGNGMLGRWAIGMGLALAVGSIRLLYQGGLPNWGTVTMLSAPVGFGAINFIMEIMATTLVASLAWRDVGEIIELIDHSFHG